ncbi:MAG: cysteine/glutathione ABC transporter permease/ATP-binding protein CydD [Shewanella sp.]|nr:cysteine/glutathione ABC transporter permease/ATP-binding protein CydD [Shewanella sp.]MCF1431947.1 cysteine/glutathione ABC transporter permease/ATP-binding protein CydD [Shewanella sp.]MCF1438892.1 cysteine/glutathione ABC transporter permease/ATP-binding protein CydD [Shewanella sp.]MCF1456181.1 cysteine/glutathione ABC transporter permease/ATP-binding protein CydD [Shewanella sp.]
MDKSLEKQLITWLRKQKSACGIFLHLSVLLGVLNGMALVAQAWLVASVLQGVIMENLPAAGFSEQYLLLAGLILLRAALAWGRERVSFQAGLRLRQTIRAAVLSKLERLGPAFIKGKPAGSWASIVLEQVEDLQDFYARYLPQMSLAAFIPLIILAVIFPQNWAGGVILLATAPLIPLFMILVGKGAADANRKNFAALSRLSGHFMDRLKGLPTLKLFFRQAQELRQIEQVSEEFRSRTMAVLRMAFLSSAVLEFFAAVSIAVLAVYFGFSYLGHLNFGHYGVPISLFTGMFVLILAPEFYQPLRDMGTHYHAKAQAIGAAEALMELLEYPEPEGEGSQTVSGPLTIEARDLRVMSMDGKCLLGPVSFSIKSGQHLALVGPSGAGKTSLMNALLGFLPLSGELTVNGISLAQLDKAALRKQLAWLGQDPQLFHASIRDNVTLGNPQLGDAQILALLERACVRELVDGQNQGLDYMMGEQGQGLSVGQAQRIALARALAQNASLFLLDEPTASLDSLSEQLVQKALTEATAGKSSLMITHRLEELQRSDEILVMDEGVIVQRGDYETLANTQGLFAEMLLESRDKGIEIPGAQS